MKSVVKYADSMTMQSSLSNPCEAGVVVVVVVGGAYSLGRVLLRIPAGTGKWRHLLQC